MLGRGDADLLRRGGGVPEEPLRQLGLYGYNNLDFDFFLVLARHSRIEIPHVVMLCEFLQRLCLADALHARLSSESVTAMQLQTLLTALTSLGLLARDDAGTYTNSPGSDLFLAKTNLKYDYGDYLRYQIDKQSARPAPNTSCSAVAEGLLCSVPIHVAPQHDHEGRGVGAEV